MITAVQPDLATLKRLTDPAEQARKNGQITQQRTIDRADASEKRARKSAMPASQRINTRGLPLWWKMLLFANRKRDNTGR
jgi:hypothetical protein